MSRVHNDSGSVPIPVESTMSRRRDVNLVRNSGSARRGLDAILSSSRFTQPASAGGIASRKFADISRARRVLLMIGRVLERKDGMAFAVLDDPISK